MTGCWSAQLSLASRSAITTYGTQSQKKQLPRKQLNHLVISLRADLLIIISVGGATESSWALASHDFRSCRVFPRYVCDKLPCPVEPQRLCHSSEITTEVTQVDSPSGYMTPRQAFY